ncbi:MAG: hypothetical protein AAB260_04915, partial [Planctomycetota bacterium]
MPRPPKGLRDIKTHLTARRPALRLGMNIGTISKPLHPRQTPRRETQRELSRAWLFTPEPN